MKYQIQFKDEHGSICKVGCFSQHQVDKMKKELRMNGVHSTVVEIDQRCVYCGSEDGWECVCLGKLLDEYNPQIDHSLLNPYVLTEEEIQDSEASGAWYNPY